MTTTVVIDIPVQEFRAIIDRKESQIKVAFEDALEALLAAVGPIQATSYGPDSGPSRPAGSTYQRTFTLARASRTRVISPDRGEWYNEAPYARFVIGSVRQQAGIHRGRWKSIEEVKTRLEEIGPGIVSDRLQKIR